MKLNGLPCLVLIEENNFYQDLASAVDCKSLVYRIEGSDKITVDDKVSYGHYHCHCHSYYISFQILSYDFLYLDTLVTNIERLERFKGRGLIIGKCIQNHVPVDVFLKQFLVSDRDREIERQCGRETRRQRIYTKHFSVGGQEPTTYLSSEFTPTKNLTPPI